MLSINPFTSYNIVDILNKPLYFIESDQLNVCNLISHDDLGFFQEYYRDYYTEIVYYEYERPMCPKCDISMNSNGSRPAKPNKWEGIRKKTIHLPRMWKNTFHKFGKFHQKILQLYTHNLRKITRIRIHYSYVLSEKGRNNQTRKME